MDPTVTHINRLPMYASSLRRWSTIEEARDAACTISLSGMVDTNNEDGVASSKEAPPKHCGNILRLSQPNYNKWDFKLFPTVEQGLQYTESLCNDGSSTANLKMKDAVQIPVPSNWTLQSNVNDNPIYTNRKYPFPCCPPYVPHKNPTGLYRLEFSLPEDWDCLRSSYSIMFQ